MIRYFFDCIFYTIFSWVAFLESKHLMNGGKNTAMVTLLDITFLFSLNLYIIFWGISVLNGFSFASYSVGKMIICYILSYGFCYYIYIYNKRHIRIIKKKQLNIKMIIITILYLMITAITFLGSMYIQKNNII